jgi:tetratricopeptide (TPR) repeat protein
MSSNFSNHQLALPHYLLLLAGGLLMVLLALTEKKAALSKPEESDFARQKSTASPSIGSQAPSNSGSAETLPLELERKIQQLANASAQDSLILISEIVELALSQDRYDVAANYQEQLFLKGKGSPDDHSVLAKTARLFYEAGLRSDSLDKSNFKDKALYYYEQYIPKVPQDLEAQVAQGVLLVRSATPMQGIQKLVKLAEENPDLYKAHLELGKFSLQTGQIEKAISRFEQAQKANDKAWEPAFYLGLAYHRINEWKKAQIAYKKAMDLAPSQQAKLVIEEQLRTIPQ